MQFEFLLNPPRPPSAEGFLAVGGLQIPLALIRNPRARRYVLRLRSDGSARVTIPRGGSAAEARRFAEHNKEWLERQVQQRATRPSRPNEWLIGTEILYRGELVRLEAERNGEGGVIRFADMLLRVPDPAANLRPPIEKYLWSIAREQLPPRVLHFACLHQLPVRRITVRNQKSRWGSCSRRGTISLNWRLVQTPPFVQDYIAIHEIMHLRQMNHSSRFWQEVRRACPDFETAERWLKQHAPLLR